MKYPDHFKNYNLDFTIDMRRLIGCIDIASVCRGGANEFYESFESELQRHLTSCLLPPQRTKMSEAEL